MELDDTIVAISTPPGRGGIGVVRLSGPQARSIVAPLLRLRHELAPGDAIFGELLDPDGNERIDEVVVTFFSKPHSYTTDDVIEISAHGSPVVLERVVELALARGARLADPGEFTMRAFLNGRIDLTQAEAVRDLIESQTLFQAKVAAQQLEGSLSRRLKPIKQKLVELIALLEAGVDFAEDDVSVLSREQILEHIAAVRAPLADLVRSFAYGKIVHQGLGLAIVGRPNVGKSSLFNRLVQRERAIVTATPGTTRDLVTEAISIEGIPVRLTDTAGIRTAHDEAETIGIQRSYEAIADADLVLIVLECSCDPSGSRQLSLEDTRLLASVAERPAIIVHNKIDLCGQRNGLGISLPKPMRNTSATTGEGIDELRSEILKQVGAAGQQEQGMLTNLRHQKLAQESIAALDGATRAAETNVPHEMLLIDLYNALRPLDAITGATTTDDILNLIFSSFCIGK